MIKLNITRQINKSIITFQIKANIGSRNIIVNQFGSDKDILAEVDADFKEVKFNNSVLISTNNGSKVVSGFKLDRDNRIQLKGYING